MEYIVTFHTHFDALQYDRFLRRLGIRGRLQPVPRALSSSCGTCVRFAAEEPVSANSGFTDMEFDKLFAIDGKEYVLTADRDLM